VNTCAETISKVKCAVRGGVGTPSTDLAKTTVLGVKSLVDDSMPRPTVDGKGIPSTGRDQFIPRRPAAARLSHPIPEMTTEGIGRVRTALLQGCSCGTATATLTQRKNSAGAVSAHVQCDTCGKSLSGSLAVRDHFHLTSYPLWQDDKRDTYWTEQHVEREKLRAGLVAKVEVTKAEVISDYFAFLRDSPEWKRLSQTMRKIHPVCQACLDAPSQVVHHLTYAYGPLPPANYLQAICRDCHNRLHADKHGGVDPWCPASLKGSPC
jgi:hypothetical protein